MSIEHFQQDAVQQGQSQTPSQTEAVSPLGLAPYARTLVPSATLAMNEVVARHRAAGHEVIR